jgi:trk system potassium uptake protein TrkA
VEEFAQGRVEMQQCTVEPDADAIGVKLSDLKLPKGVRVAAFLRGESGFIPNRETQAEENDMVYLIGETSVIEQARKFFHRGKTKRKHVAIMGGSPISVWLCRALTGRSFSLRLFETHEPRAEELALKLDHVTVVAADPTDEGVFNEENLQAADAFVALTADDEHNILAAGQAKSLGVRQVLAIVQRPTYMHLLQHVGIDTALSPRRVAAKEIQNLIEDRPVRCLASLAEGTADVYEVRPTVQGQATDAPLKDIRLPAGVIIAAIQRGDKVKVPGANDKILAGDTLIVIGPQGNEKEIRKLFVGK